MFLSLQEYDVNDLIINIVEHNVWICEIVTYFSIIKVLSIALDSTKKPAAVRSDRLGFVITSIGRFSFLFRGLKPSTTTCECLGSRWGPGVENIYVCSSLWTCQIFLKHRLFWSCGNIQPCKLNWRHQHAHVMRFINSLNQCNNVTCKSCVTSLLCSHAQSEQKNCLKNH